MPFDRNRLVVLPVLSRLEAIAEVERSKQWKDVVKERFENTLREWLPKDVACEEAIDRLAIPNIPAWSFSSPATRGGEPLPVVQEGSSDPRSLGFAYGSLAKLILSGFEWKAIFQPDGSAGESRNAEQYDVFISHASKDSDWCTRLAERLRDQDVRVWFWPWQIKPGDRIEERLGEGLENSQKMVAVWTEDYFADSKTCAMAEAYTARSGRKRTLVPVLLRDCKISPAFQGLHYLDFRNPDDFDRGFDLLLEALECPGIQETRVTRRQSGWASSSIEFHPVMDAIKGKRCLPFLGEGASAGYSVGGREVPGIPRGGKLGEKIANACGYTNGSTYDLARVAEYFVYSKNGNRDDLEELISTEIAQVNQPRPLQTALAQLEEVRFVITSNYDNLLESELRRYQRKLTKHYYDLQNPKTGHFNVNPFIKPPEIVLHKMNGTVEHPRSMVITQSDYIRYLANLNDPDRGMPEFFRKTIIPSFNLLFLGYSLEDWNFQVIWEGVLANYRDAGTQLESYAILKLPADPQTAGFLRTFWTRRNITLIDCDLTEFAVELAKAFKLDLPQLDILKGEQAKGGVTS